MKKGLLLGLLSLFMTPLAHAQPPQVGWAIEQDLVEENEKERDIYQRNLWVSGGIIGAGLVVNNIFLRKVKDKQALDHEELRAIDPADVPGIDQWALRQDPEKRWDKHRLSDRIFEVSTLLPAILIFDEDIRPEALDMLLMYLETHALSAALYSVSPLGPISVDRYRPLAYYDAVKLDDRLHGETRNSFYSGHVATVAASTFFTAKVYADYHPGMSGGEKVLLYTLAAVPPVTSAILRIQALKHFPSDTAVGLGFGIASGLLIPTLHKNWLKPKTSNFAVSGFYGGGAAGGAMVWKF